MWEPSKNCSTRSDTRSTAVVRVHGEGLRYVRKQRQMTMTELAETCGVSTSYINKLETEPARGMRLDKFRRMRTALGLGSDECGVLMAKRVTAPTGAAA